MREFKFLVYDCLVLHSIDQVAQSLEQAPVTSEIVGSISTSDSRHLREECVNALPTVVDFLRVLRFPSIGNVNRGG